MEKEFLRTRLTWRHTHRQPKFFAFDYRTIFFIVAFLFYIRIWTFFLLISVMLFFWFLGKRKIEPDNVLRWVRASFAGRNRTPQGVSRMRKPIDFGFETSEHVGQEEKRLKRIRERRKDPKFKGERIPDFRFKQSKRLPLRERFTTARSG